VPDGFDFTRVATLTPADGGTDVAEPGLVRRDSRRPPVRRLIRNVVLIGVAMILGLSIVVLMPQRPPSAAVGIAGLAAIATLLLAALAAQTIGELGRRAAHEEELAAERSELQAEITRRRAAELAARNAQAMLQDAVESIAEAFIIFDADDRLVMFNDACRRLYNESAMAVVPGMSFEEMLRAGLAKGQYAEAIGREQEWLAERLRHHRELDGSVEQLLPDGRHLLITERRMRNGGTAGLRIDITRLKETEIQLRQMMQHLDRVQLIAGIGSTTEDLATGRFNWSPGAAAIFGVDSDSPEPTPAYMRQFYHPDDRGRIIAAAEQSRLHGVAAAPLEYRIIRPDGAVRTVYRENAIERDANGAPVRRIVTFKDITELKAAEAQLRDTMEHLDRVQRIAGIGSTTHHLVTGHFEWSAGACAIFGIEADNIEPTVQYFRQFVHPDDKAKVRAAAEQAAQEGVPAPPMEYRIVRPDGAVRTVYRENAVERDGQGQPIRRIVTFKDITELKQTEARLREAMEHLHRIQRIAGIGSLEVTLDTGHVAWSPEACAIFGVDPASVEPTDEFIVRHLHPDDRDLVRRIADQANASGVAAPPLEYRIIRPDGAERLVYRENAIKYDAAGRPVTRIITYKDITELKAAEAQLRDMMDNLDRAQRLAHVGSYSRGIDGKAQWSAEMYRIFGVDPQTFKPTRTNLLRLIAPEDRAKIIAAYRQVAAGVCPAPFEHRIRRPSGEIRLIHSNFELIHDRGGRVTGMGGMILDITETRRVESQLREMMDNLDRAQRLAHMGSYTRDVDGTGRWSAEVYRIFGVDPQTFKPTMENFLSAVVPEDRAIVAAAHREMQDGNPTAPFEYRIRRPNGEIRHIHRITELIHDNSGKVSGTGGTLWDITELRAAEQRQKELERQLLHSQKLEALGRLAGGVAHDLNNTLVPILSLASLALEDLPEGDPLRDDIQTIVAAGERARELVRQILAFSRKQDIQKRETDLADAVRQALQMLRVTLPSNIVLIDEVHEVPRIFADGGQLQQVVVNLVTNAAQAIGEAHGSIVVELTAPNSHSGRRPGRFVRLRVADTGPGIDRAVLDHIFEPFFTTKPVGEGTGLGLAVVHGIVTGHGGTIEAKSSAKSKPHKGTVFTVMLPLPEPAAVGAAA
jgi:PAS domain S-box-containing protein